jgi:hypothetical protein
MRAARIIAVVVLIVGNGSTLQMPQAQLSGTSRTDLQRHDLSVPGPEVVHVRGELDPGVSSPKHWHPAEESVKYRTQSATSREAKGRRERAGVGRSPSL